MSGVVSMQRECANCGQTNVQREIGERRIKGGGERGYERRHKMSGELKVFALSAHV